MGTSKRQKRRVFGIYRYACMRAFSRSSQTGIPTFPRSELCTHRKDHDLDHVDPISGVMRCWAKYGRTCPTRATSRCNLLLTSDAYRMILYNRVDQVLDITAYASIHNV